MIVVLWLIWFCDLVFRGLVGGLVGVVWICGCYVAFRFFVFVTYCGDCFCSGVCGCFLKWWCNLRCMLGV